MDELCVDFAPIGPVHRSVYRNTYDYPTRTLATLLNPREVRRIAMEWEALNVNVVHINKQNLEDGLDLIRAANCQATPSVCTVHLTQTAVELKARFGWWRDIMARSILDNYRGELVVVEELRRKALCDFLGLGPQIVTIENGVEPFDESRRESLGQAMRESLGWSKDDFVLCSVGRMVEQKRPLLFVEVALKWLQENSLARFLWVGDGPLAEAWDQRVQKAGAQDQIRRLPWQPSSTPCLAAADVYVHTAAYEGLPFALLEAMAAGLPCLVAEDLAAAMPALQPGELITFNKDRGLSAVEMSPERLQLTAAAGRAAVDERFSLSRMASRYIALYHQLARAPRL